MTVQLEQVNLVIRRSWLDVACPLDLPSWRRIA
jgi:hypothetical protein